MKRRDILKHSAVFAGAALSAGTIASVISGCQTDGAISTAVEGALSADHLSLVAEVAERIIPKTDTPGAKDANVAQFISRSIADNFTDEEKTQFIDGLSVYNTKAEAKFSKNFESLSDEEKDQILTEVVAGFKSDASSDAHNWPALKGMVITGYFTSEVGAKQALKYDPIPGEWQGCVDYDEVGGLWAI